MRVEYRTCGYGNPQPKRCIVYNVAPDEPRYCEAHAIVTQGTGEEPYELYSYKFSTYVQLSPTSKDQREALQKAGYRWFWDCPRPELAAVAHSVAAGDCPPGVLFDLVREQPDCPPWVAEWLDGLTESP